MELPKSTFYNYAMRNEFFVAERNMYEFKRGCIKKEGGVIEVVGKPVDLGLMEKLYLSDLEEYDNIREIVRHSVNRVEHVVLAQFVIEDVVGNKAKAGTKKNATTIYDVVPGHGMLVNKGLYYVLKRKRRGGLKVGGRRYDADSKAYPIECIERDYQKRLKMRILKKDKGIEDYVKKKFYYNRNKNIGFYINYDDFYVFTKVEPYVLYEREDRWCYKFDRAWVGSRLTLNGGEIKWSKLVVLDRYTHPALPEANRPFQNICVGNFNYESIRDASPDNLPRQVVDLMYKGRNVLTRDYRTPEKAYHSLAANMFKGQRVKWREGMQVLNC